MQPSFPDPSKVHNVVVFISAVWSGYSKISFEQLENAVKVGLDNSWQIVVLDTDHIDFNTFTRFYGPFPSSGGWGEAFWIKEGKVIYSDPGYYNDNLIELLSKRVAEFSILTDA